MDNKTIYYVPTPPKPALLLIVGKDGNVRNVTLKGDMRMGRDFPGAQNDIKINSDIVSKNHGDFFFIDNKYYYRDNNSRNGTFHNGRKLQRRNDAGSEAVQLNDGDVLRIDCNKLDKPHSSAVAVIFSTSFQSSQEWKIFYLNKETYVTIGRNIPRGISLNDFMVSRNHAFLKLRDGKWTITDNNSKNGLAVNKIMTEKERVLNPFDVIRIANTSLIFLGDKIVYSKSVSDTTEHSAVMNVNINSVVVPPRKTLLKDINIDIESGDFTMILGSSGAGKTTFIKALLGEQPINGGIMFEGMDFHKNFRMLKHKVGFVPQFSNTRDNDSVYDTIRDTATLKLGNEYSNKEIRQRVDEVIEKMDLENLKKNMIKNLSGGQKKRVEVAMQAIGDQKIFILDEPDSGMDYASRVDLMENLKPCTEKGGVVLVITHSPDDAASFFNKIIVIAKSEKDGSGHLAYYGNIKDARTFFEVERLIDITLKIQCESKGGRPDYFIGKFNEKFKNERSML